MAFKQPRNYSSAVCFSLHLAIALSIFASVTANATVTFTPTLPYAMTGSVWNLAGDAGGVPAAASIVDTIGGYLNLDLSSTASSNMIIFNIVSNKAIGGASAADPLVVSIYMANAAGTGFGVVPIKAASLGISTGTPALCSSGLSACRVSSSNYYSAAYTTGQTLRVGINLADICADNVVGRPSAGITILGCSGGLVVEPGLNAVSDITMYVEVGVEPDVGYVPKPSSDESAAITLRLQSDPSYDAAADLPCSTAVQLPIYYPSDGAILVFPANIGTLGTINVTNGAAAKAIVIAATTPVGSFTGANWNAANYLVMGRAPITQAGYSVGGFVNDQGYDLSYSVQDAAGFIISDGLGDFPENFCTYDGGTVETLPIRGFLSESNCFISTAAFGSPTAWPVMILREFRDSLLNKTEFGRDFIQFYYRHSPPMAEWLIQHPWPRLQVAALLLPIVVLAWLALNPAAAAILFFLALIGLRLKLD